MPYGYFMWDPTFIILIPVIILTIYAQSKVKKTVNQYMKISNIRNYTGEQIARLMLNRNGLNNIPIEIANGKLGDHYDPVNRVLRLSYDVFQGKSIASASIAAHEVGHAIQHSEGYAPLALRKITFPVARFGSSAAWIFILVGLIMPSFYFLLDIGIILFAAGVVFQIITLPVEFNASKRGLMMLSQDGYLYDSEMEGARKVLNAAALTYVAAMAAGLAQLIRLLIIRGNRR